MNAREWINAYADRLGTEPPTNEEWSTLLDVAASAAHASDRVAAPIACWVAGRAGVGPEAALEIARGLETDD